MSGIKRINVEPCIFIRIQSNGKILKKPFEITKARTIPDHDLAFELYDYLTSMYDTVYIYHTRVGYRVVFQCYSDNLLQAIDIRDRVESTLEEYEGV